MAIPAIVGTLLIPILMQILKMMTPTLRAELVTFIQGWTERAYATPNKWDDVAVKLVAAILSVDLSGVKTPPVNDAITDAVVGALVEVTTGHPFDQAMESGGG